MDFLGDLALVIGAIGVVIYMCLIVIRYASSAGRVNEAIRRTETQNERLEQRLQDYKQRRDAIDPDVNALVERVIGLREQRDRLHFRYEEMVARSREREINIKYKTH